MVPDPIIRLPSSVRIGHVPLMAKPARITASRNVSQPVEIVPGREPELRRRIETHLDQGHGECLLRDPRLAKVVADALHTFDGTRYRLHEWVIMPNHVHVLITPLHENSLSAIVHSWKSFTAKQINGIRGTAGRVWQEDYFDRMIRDERHWHAAVAYIRDNPVKAGLSATAADYPFSSASVEEASEARAGRPRSQDDLPLNDGGTGAQAYADSVSVYLSFALSSLSDRLSTICTWDAGGPTWGTKTRNTFARQAIPMSWDFAEVNPLSTQSGSIENSLDYTTKGVVCAGNALSHSIQSDAGTQEISLDRLISTYPPYYDNIGYADLSDFFYVWLRRSLKGVFPDLFATLAVPKAEELVATPYRHGSKEKAEAFFLTGMTQAMHRLASQAHPAFPVTIYYAFKQAETRSEERSQGDDRAPLGERASRPLEAGTA